MKKRISNIPKPRQGAWFVKVRGSYLPATWQGWLTYIPFIAFLELALMAGMDNNHSFSDLIFRVFPAWVAAAVVMTWIAARKS